MKYTENYNLKKPDKEDFYNVEDFNENADVIDVELKKLNDKLSPERVRAIYVSTDDPDDGIGEDGDIWIKYEE